MAAKRNGQQHLSGSLSRRERQIMDVLLRRQEATATQVHAELPDPPSYDAVRTTLRILSEKGAVRRRSEGARYVYFPAVDPKTARDDALSYLVKTFFQGSSGRAALALLKRADLQVDDAELVRLQRKIEGVEEKDRHEKSGGRS